MLTRRDFAIFGGAAVAGTTIGRSTEAPAGIHPIPSIDPMALVNPEFRDALRPLLQEGGDPTWTEQSLPKLRKREDAWNSEQLQLLRTPKVARQLIPGFNGDPEVPVYVVGAELGQAKPAVLHIHGGGFIAGSARSLLRLTQDIALACGCVVVAPEYRLAPETPFPGPLDDNYAALLWLYRNAKQLGIDPRRIAIVGESAGGGLAAMLAVAARDRGEVPVTFQVLIYPMLDDRTGSTGTVPPFIGQFIWTPADNRFGWSALLGRPAGSRRVAANSVPAGA